MVAAAQQNIARAENLGPAERILQVLTTHTDHLVHNRPGIVVGDTRPTARLGVRWEPAIWKQEGDVKVVYRIATVELRSTQVRAGILDANGDVREAGRVIGRYKKPGLYPEAVEWTYRQIAEIWKLDNEFAAHFGSWAWPMEHRDLKVALAAFLLVQNRCGDPIHDKGVVAFYDEDYRDVGEAMCLLRGEHDLNPKLLLRVGHVLELDVVAKINRELGFGKSGRTAVLGRYPKAVTRWLQHREQNPKMLEGLVKAGFRTTVMALARKVGYRPETPKFFEVLRWKQDQSKDGRRTIAIGVERSAAETWEGLSETAVCERIMETKPNWKRIVGMLPKSVGLTRAVMTASIEAGSLSDQDIVILTPTLEDLGLLDVEAVKARWQTAMGAAENQRAANIAKRVKRVDVAEALQESADKATTKALEEVTKNLRVYVVVDKSGSMEGSIAEAKRCLTKFLGGFPLERTHISVFNTVGTELKLKAASGAAVEAAFRGHAAGGGTHYASGLRAIAGHAPEQDEDALVLFVGDEGDNDVAGLVEVARTLRPVAFGLLKVPGQDFGIVRHAAAQLGIPCMMIDTGMFEDAYAVTRTLRNLIASTPVGTVSKSAAFTPRKTLVQAVLDTPLLARPPWVM